MSNNQQTEKTVTNRLQQVQAQYRRRGLEIRLEDVADDLREILLERSLCEALFNIEIETDPDLQSELSSIRGQIDESDLEGISDRIANLEEQVDQYESKLWSTVSGPQTTYRSNVDSMEQLNSQLGKVDSEDLDELSQLLAEGDWLSRADVDLDNSLSQQLETVRSFGQTFHEIYIDAEELIFEPYFEGRWGEEIKKILAEESFSLEDASAGCIEFLRESDLGPHLEIRLG